MLIRKSLLGIFFTMAVSLSTLIFFSWLAFDRSYEAKMRNEAVDHTYLVQLKNKELLRVMLDTETGQRGYMVSRNVTFLEPYNDGRRELYNTIKTLRALVSDNPTQVQRLDTLKQLIYLKIALMQTNIDRVQRGQQIDMTELIKGKNAMNQVRAVSKRFDQMEQNLQVQRDTLQKTADESLSFYILLLPCTALLFLLLFFQLLYLELYRRLRFQTMLEEKLRELERTNAELEQFAYVASHDLQEPLRKIRTFSERLLRKHVARFDEDGQMNLHKINESATRMQQLINDLLAFSRTTSARELDFETVDLNLVLASVKDELSEAISIKNAQISIESLPTLTAISYQMKQLFLNLISNALKYSKLDQPPVVRVAYEEISAAEINPFAEARPETVYHHFSISDNGIGFESQYAEKIFLIFQRLHNRNEYEGTGIGLAICRRIVTNHKGFIRAESEVGKGTIFHVYLPIITTEDMKN